MAEEKKYNEELCEQVRQGKLAIENTDYEKVGELLKYIFPMCTATFTGVSEYYHSKGGSNTEWYGSVVSTRPRRPVSDFFVPSSPIQEAEADVLEKEAVERIHELKTWPVYWFKVFMGRKTFEVRKNDRDFKVGDILILKEYDLESDTYTGRNLSRRVTFILEGGGFGIEEGFCVMSIQ